MSPQAHALWLLIAATALRVPLAQLAATGDAGLLSAMRWAALRGVS